MRKLTYLPILEPSVDGYDVFYPDLPDCISFGKDIEEAQQMAKEALALHIYGIEKTVIRSQNFRKSLKLTTLKSVSSRRLQFYPI